MKTRWTIYVAASLIGFAGVSARAGTTFNDGAYHRLDGNYGYVYVQNFWDEPTTVELVSGGKIDYHLRAYDGSNVTISGGKIDYDLRAYDSSNVAVSGGSIG